MKESEIFQVFGFYYISLMLFYANTSKAMKAFLLQETHTKMRAISH